MIATGVLSGIRVLDFSTLLPGPMATLFLAEAGAEVIKIENPAGGDDMRHYHPRWDENSANFHLLNRGKKSIALDLKSPDDKERLRPLLETADILVEQFRPGVMSRLGFSYDDVRAIKPDLIYCSITGYGQTGPHNMKAGHDLNYQGDTGLLALSTGSVDAPVVPPALIADIGGGTYPALINILLALYHRSQTGEGAFLDIAMAENLFPFTYWAQAKGMVTGNWPGSGDALVTGGTCRYRLYPTADGRIVAVAAIEQKFWDRFCEAIDLDSDFRDDAASPEATMTAIAERIAKRSSEEWRRVFEAVDCCCSVVVDLRAAMDDRHFQARNIFSEKSAIANGKQIPALPTPICAHFRPDKSTVRSAPLLGAHTQEFAPASPDINTEGSDS